MENALGSIRNKSWKPAGRTSLGLSRPAQDRLAARLLAWLTMAAVASVPLMALALYLRARPILSFKPLTELLLSTTWHPLKGDFGFYPFIMGTFWVTGAAMAIAVPPSLLTAIYLAEYASPKTRALAKPLIDLLAGIPSVVYGVWGVLTVVPLIERIAPTLDRWLGYIPSSASTIPPVIVCWLGAGVGRDGVPRHHRRGRGGHPRCAPGAARGIAGARRHPLANRQTRRAAPSLARGDRRGGLGLLASFRGNHGGAHGGRQHRAKCLILSSTRPIPCQP